MVIEIYGLVVAGVLSCGKTYTAELTNKYDNDCFVSELKYIKLMLKSNCEYLLV